MEFMGADANYPRTLIINAHFTEQSGSGTLLGQLFSGWPVDRLATIASNPETPDWRRCQRHYRTGEMRLPLRVLAYWVVSGIRFGPMLPSASVVTSSCLAEVSPYVSLNRRLIRYFWRMLLRIMHGKEISRGEIFLRIGPSPQLLAWVRDFQPEVLYGHCAGLNSVLFLLRMQQVLGLPLVLHFMDDWSENCYLEGCMAKLLRPCFQAEFRKLVRSADVTIAICQEMAEEYKKRYQRPVLWLPMPVELGVYQTVARIQWTAGRPFCFQYGGRVGWAIRESLADLTNVVNLLRQGGANVNFDIWTGQTEEVPAVCFSSTGITVHSLIPVTEWSRLQAEADVQVICYDFDPKSFCEARYSMPSKLAPCMASGTPILIYGPAGLPVVEYARREGWGKVVDRRDPMALRAAMCELMGSATLREQLGRNAKRLAAERHDAKIVAEEMRRILTAAASDPVVES